MVALKIEQAELAGGITRRAYYKTEFGAQLTVLEFHVLSHRLLGGASDESHDGALRAGWRV